MKKLVIRNIKKGFATNSSSYHSTLILTEDEYEKWKSGEISFEDISYGVFEDNDGYDDDSGLYYYIESQSERTLDDGTKVIAITYCETNEY